MASLEAARTHGIAKASWLQRQSDFLCRWKYSFCILYRNGNFIYYADENLKTEQGRINLAKNFIGVKLGKEVRNGVTPPSGRDINCLLELRSVEMNVVFCTDSIDDSVTWKSSIVEVRNAHMQPPPPAQPQGFGPAPLAAPPPYTVTQAVPSGQQVVLPPVQQVYVPPVQQVYVPPVQQVNPFGGVTTYTYQTPNTQYVVPPTNQTVIISRGTRIRSGYPAQNTVYTYPGQTMFTGQSTVTRYY